MGVASLSCEITILRAKNVELISQGTLFVRYYLSAGKNRRIQLNTQEIFPTSNLTWNENFSLECLGTEDSINNLKQQSVVFELRWRSTNPVLGKMRGSQVLSRAEVPWKLVLESPKMKIENWVVMVPKKRCLLEGFKPPSIQIAMSVGVPIKVADGKRKRDCRLKKWDNCECCSGSGCNCGDYDIFALAAALEAL